MRTNLLVLACMGLAAIRAAPAAAQAADADVRLNQIQVIGTHNSYRSSISPAALAWLNTQDPKVARKLDYAHPDLVQQLDAGVRQIEIDIYADSKGGAYAHPKGAAWERAAGIRPGADDIAPVGMSGTDFKVMHIVDLDQRANCEPFRQCLRILHAWSQRHPQHLPLFVDIEIKQTGPKSGRVAFSEPERFTPATYDRLDTEIRDTITPAGLIVPDQVRGDAVTLNQAIRDNGWPTLAQARGKLVFLLDRPADTALYVLGHESLRGRVLFTNATPGTPDAAFTEENNDDPAPARRAEAEQRISRLVRQGYLVRTRADADTEEAHANDGSRRDIALRSGAQMVTTDYPASEPARWTGYMVALPGKAIARCNPVNAPADCTAAGLAEPR